MHRVAITGRTSAGWAYVRSLRGDDEEAIESAETATAIALIDRLLVRVPGAAYAPGDAHLMCAADRDRILAAVYERELGRRIASSPACPACGKRFDVEFDLPTIAAALVPDHAGRAADGTFTTASGMRFRLPTGEDELCAAHEADPMSSLLARCHLDGPGDPEALSDAMERVAPMIDVELEATCPECGHDHVMRFDIQSYLLGALIGERRQRSIEVHRLARTLGWSLTEILSMTRAQRRLHSELADRG